MINLGPILLVFAFVLFTIAAVWNPSAPSPAAPWFGRLIAAGLACWVLADVLGGVHLIGH
jgi:hypothetical protein